jgi:alpha-amylase
MLELIEEHQGASARLLDHRHGARSVRAVGRRRCSRASSDWSRPAASSSWPRPRTTRSPRRPRWRIRRAGARQAARIEALFGRRPTTFRNTELVVSNHVARRAEELGSAHPGRGRRPIARLAQPHRVYRPEGCERIKLLLRSYRFSDDIAFRFSNRSGPSTRCARALRGLAHRARPRERLVGLFMDLRDLRRAPVGATGIFRFMRGTARGLLRRRSASLQDAGRGGARARSRARLDIPHAMSWADAERDLTAWLGNRCSSGARGAVRALARRRALGAGRTAEAYRRWRKLSTSDHVYYMCTKWFSDGDVHKYFSPMPRRTTRSSPS